MELPKSSKLDIGKLSSIFGDKSAAYKFYWFISLLKIVRKKRTRMSFGEIVAGMIAESWYPIHYYNLSFGKIDSLFKKSLQIQKNLQISIKADKSEINSHLIENIKITKKYLRVFTLNVPYRFLSPWIKYTYDDDVIVKSQSFTNDCLYAIYDK